MRIHHAALLVALPITASAQLTREGMIRELCPRGRGVARTLRLGRDVQIQGAGSTVIQDTTVYGWSGTDCVAWVRVAGGVSPTADESRVELGERGSFAARVENGSVTEYRFEANGARSVETFTIDGRSREIGDGERTWIADVVGEYMRRAGIRPQARAARIARESGAAGLLREAMRIPRDDIKAEYLTVGFLFVGTQADARASYLRDASAMLGQGTSLARFLLVVPTEWLASEPVLLAALAAAARIEGDDGAEAVLQRAVPGKPSSAAVGEAVRRIIATLGNSERRAALLARYGP